MSAPRVTLVDYGAGNIFNLHRALTHLGAECDITNDPARLARASHIALPGVGAFGALVERLHEVGAWAPLAAHLAARRPFLGICLGLQVLFDGSDETPGAAGFGVFPGRVARFATGKVPHMGWNDVVPGPGCALVQPGVAYFVHSFRAAGEVPGAATATCDYGGSFVAAIEREGLLAVQFHPEKSGDYGMALLQRWLAC